MQLHSIPAGRLVYTLIEMTWGFGLRPSESPEYTFTFAGEGKSTESYPTFEVGCAQLVESSISGFLSKWTERAASRACARASPPTRSAVPDRRKVAPATAPPRRRSRQARRRQSEAQRQVVLQS